MATPPTWVLAIIYWLHMLATVAWVGSLAAISILILPASKRTLNLTDQLSFISTLQKRLEPIAWFSISLLIVTGLIQMSTSPHYDGFLSISTQWSLAILTKHVLGIIMIVVSAIQTWEVIPAIHRILMKKENANPDELARLQRREIILLRANLIVSVLILGATAVARVS
ncbi:MAG: CopD family protein [Anaerolineales bacterium]|nr:CopD family protein [Anaerolineales bacterium]